MAEADRARGLTQDAVNLAARGFRVFPLRPNDKKPPAGLSWPEVATSDPDAVAALFEAHPGANIGVSTAGVCVVDIENKPAADGKPAQDGRPAWRGIMGTNTVPATVKAKSGGGGWHAWFLEPPGWRIHNSAAVLGPAVDTRGRGGYVVAPPSRHPSGGTYEWLVSPWETAIAPIPEWLLLELVRRGVAELAPGLRELIAPVAPIAPLNATRRRPGGLDFARTNAAALACLEAICAGLLPDGRRRGREYVARNPRRADEHAGSFSVNLTTGVWKDFATADVGGGDPVSLVAYLRGESMGDACRLLDEWLDL